MKTVLADTDKRVKDLRDEKKDLLKSISDIRYGQDMRKSRDSGNSIHVDALRKRIKELEKRVEGVRTKLKSLRHS